MITKSDPYSINIYRESTENQSALAGVMNPSFRCPKCKQTRLMAGRKQRIRGVSKSGYICAECVQKREARRAKKAAAAASEA